MSAHSTPELQITFSKSLTLEGAAGGTTLMPTMDTGTSGASIGIATFDACVVTNNRGVASSDGSTSAGMLITDFFGPGTVATVLNSTITDNTTDIAVGFDAAEGSEVTVRNSSITGNDYGIVSTSAGAIVDAVGNWWGDPSGPADASGTIESDSPLSCASASFTPSMDVLNADGTGDSVTDANVDYCTWLSEPPLLTDQDVVPDAIFGAGNANVVCSPPSGSTFPVGTTTVTCTATDACGNVSTSTFDVTVTPTNLVDVTVDLVGSGPATRCITFVMDGCGDVADVPLTFTGIAPATVTTSIEVPCGVWTKICAKDQQHTQWAETTVTDVGAKYVATATLALEGGDTDDDGEVDINDVTQFIAQFGSTAVSGGCPWSGARDSDFSNNGVIGSEDYSFLVANFFTTSSCSCSLVAGDRKVRHVPEFVVVENEAQARADLNLDGRVDVRDVELFEQANGLSGELSRRMRDRRQR